MSVLPVPGEAPLSPMPDAPPEVIAGWLTLISRGNLISLGGTIAWLLMLALASLGGVASSAVAFIGFPLLSIVWLVGGWMLTPPEPGNPYRLVWMRWITRGCLGVAVVQAIMEPWVSRLHRSQLDAVAILSVWLQAAGMAGATAMSWYLSRLAARLRDRILRALWVCLAFVLGILFALLAIGFASDWKETVHEEALRLSASGAEATAASVRFWSSTPFWAIVGLCLAVFCLATPWRLHFKLIAARKRLISQAKCRRGG